MVPADYEEKVYAGVLGKIIGVYLGRPFEGWSHERIESELGPIEGYVHDRLGQPLIVADDDISGTFTFIRATQDFGPDVTPEQIGETWLNYLIENRTVLWWGGLGMSTEHTAYLRLKQGIKAPRSGSKALNGSTVAEQIGAQIFIDGWGMLFPGEPDRAADYARRAASVSHDGEAVFAAQLIAGIEAMAFVEQDIPKLLQAGMQVIPGNSLIARLVEDIRHWHATGESWRAGFQRIKEKYGYSCFGGGCHVVPNHALILHALLHGEGDFDRSLMIVNTCGWDTDCNSGNLGCILGIRNGLAGIHPRWREPVRDRILLPTADGGRCVTDAVREADQIIAAAKKLRGGGAVPAARFNFRFRGALQGFESSGAELSNPNASLRIELTQEKATILTGTFPTQEQLGSHGYSVMASPSLNPGQTIRAQLSSEDEVFASLCVGTQEGYVRAQSEHVLGAAELQFQVPHVALITSVGLEIAGRPGTVVELHDLDWSEDPSVVLDKDWRGGWVNGVDAWPEWGAAYRLAQNRGEGLLLYGCREWRDYSVSAGISANLAEAFGLCARAQGMRRYYALRLVRPSRVQLVKRLGEITVLAETEFNWTFGAEYEFELRVQGDKLLGRIDDIVLNASDDSLYEGGIALLVAEGRIDCESVRVSGG